MAQLNTDRPIPFLSPLRITNYVNRASDHCQRGGGKNREALDEENTPWRQRDCRYICLFPFTELVEDYTEWTGGCMLLVLLFLREKGLIKEGQCGVGESEEKDLH